MRAIINLRNGKRVCVNFQRMKIEDDKLFFYHDKELIAIYQYDEMWKVDLERTKGENYGLFRTII